MITPTAADRRRVRWPDIPHHLTLPDDIRGELEQRRIDVGRIALDVAQPAFCRHINPRFPECCGKPAPPPVRQAPTVTNWTKTSAFQFPVSPTPTWPGPRPTRSGTHHDESGIGAQLEAPAGVLADMGGGRGLDSVESRHNVELSIDYFQWISPGTRGCARGTPRVTATGSPLLREW